MNSKVAASSALPVLLSAIAAVAQAQTPPAEAAVVLDRVVVEDRAEAETASVVEDTPSTSLRDVFAEDISANVGGPTATSQKVFVNGLEENNLNVQVDGARQSNNIWHHNANLLIDPGLLKAVSLDAGVAAADAGPAALAGSLRYETRDVADLLAEGRSVGAFLGGSYDSNGETFTESGAAYGRAGAFEALGYASYADGSNYEDGAGSEVQGTGAKLLSTLGKLAYVNRAGGRFELSGQYLVDDEVRPYRANFAGVRGTVTLADNQFERRSLTAEYSTTQPTAYYDPELRFYVNQTSISRPSPSGGFERGYFDSTVRSVGGTLQNAFELGLGELTAGLDFYDDESETDNFADPLYTESATDIGLFAQLRSQPLRRLELSTGLRFDYQELHSVDDLVFDNSGWSPNLSLRFALTDALALSGGYSYVFGGIPLAAAGLFHSFPYAYSDDLEPQTARNGKLGAEFTLRGLTLEAEAFSSEIENTAAYNEEAEPFVRVNGPELSTEGYSLAAAYEWARAELGVQYTDTDVEYDHAEIGTTAFSLGSPVGEIVKLHGAYSWPGLGLSAGASSEIAFEYDYDDDSGNTDLDSYETWNLFAQWRPVALRRLTLRAEANNVTDEDYVNRFTAGSSLGFVSPLKDPGRSFLLSTRFVF